MCLCPLLGSSTSGEDVHIVELGSGIELLEIDEVLKLLAPVEGGFEVALVKDGDFHGHCIVICSTCQNAVLAVVVFEGFAPFWV